jgi:hypothetical protein
VHETDAELDALQQLIDASIAAAGPHMRDIFTTDRRLSARQLAVHLQGTRHVAFATVNAAGKPRVAPLDGLFFHAHFYVGTGGHAARLRHLRRNPSVSLTHFQGEELAVIVHGTVFLMEKGHSEVGPIEELWTEIYGSSPFDLGEGVTMIRVEPEAVFTFASDPSRFPVA